MLSQANLQPAHVFSEWGLGASSDFIDEVGRSREICATSIPNKSTNDHNNTVNLKVTSTQIAAYSPIEDKLYVNEAENIFGVFDGHGGDICSRYVVEKVPQHLLSSMKFKKPQTENDYISTLKNAFMRVDEHFLTEHRSIVKTSASGSCGVTVLVRNDTLYVSNLGDSRVLLGSGTSHELLTNDHNTKNEKERALVQQRTTDPMPIRGHAVQKIPGERVGGVLMVTRAFGDGIFKRRDMSLAPFIPHLPYITSEPEITVRKLTPQDKYAIISSDGLYDYLTPADVAATVAQQMETTTDGSKIATALIERQFEKIASLAKKTVDQIKAMPNRKEVMDDISIIVMIFSHPSPSITGEAAK